MLLVRASLIALAAALAAPNAFAQDPKPTGDKTAQKQRAATKKKAKDPGPEASFPGFEMLPDGGSRVFVDITRKVEVVEHVSPGLVTYTLKGVHVPSSNDQNALETYYYNTPVVRAKLRKAKKETDLFIQLRGDAQPTFRIVDMRSGAVRLEVDFKPGSFAASEKDPPPATVVDRDKPRTKKKGGGQNAPSPPPAKGPKP